jgi:hypothetical protein
MANTATPEAPVQELAKYRREAAERVLKSMLKLGVSPGFESTAMSRAAEAPAGLRGKALNEFIRTGNGLSDQQEEARDERVAQEQGAAAQDVEAKPAGEADSVPFREEDAAKLKGEPGYFAFAVDPEGGYSFIGAFSGRNRTAMVREARKALVEQVGEDEARSTEIVSARPSNLRLTPALD